MTGNFSHLETPQIVPEIFEETANSSDDFAVFDFGLTICHFFEHQKKQNPSGAPAIGGNDGFSYHESICYVMEFKNLSPHSMGMIYRSLYVPVNPAE